MSDFHPRCPKCDKPMDRGYVPDASQGHALQSSWAPGPPQVRKVFGGIKYPEDELIPLTAYRCSSCGFIEFYARSS